MTIQKFKEDCNIHLAINSCVMYGHLLRVIQLDFAMEIEFELDKEEGIILTANWSLHNLLEKL